MKTRVRITVVAEYDIEPDGIGYRGILTLDECIAEDLANLRYDMHNIGETLNYLPEDDIKVTLEPVPVIDVIGVDVE